MKHGEAEEAGQAQADADSQSDAIDHERLARLVGASREPGVSYSPASTVAALKKSNTPLIAIVIVVAALALGGLGVFLFRSRTVTKPVQPQPTPGTPTGQNGNPTTYNIKPDLVKIPGGTFQMGRTDGAPIEEPAHPVKVEPFLMDRTEVTNAEYELFVRETQHKAPSHWENNRPLAGQEQWPVTNVSYEDAVAFAAWRSQRDGVTYSLPTEEQWEYAARNGEQDDLYPWGNSWEQGRAVIEEVSPKPVGSMPSGKNKWGVVDLIGDVWEWTSTKANLYPGNKAAIPPEQREMMVFRGGSYGTKMKGTPTTGAYRDWQKPATIHPTLGFRLVREAQ